MSSADSLSAAALDALCARQRLDLIGEITGGLAHELNNALTVLSGYGDLALESFDEDRMDPKELSSQVRTIHNWTGTAMAAARRLYRFSLLLRAPEGIVEVNEVVADTVELCRYRCEREQILLVVDPCKARAQVRGRAGLLSQVVVNLIQNAREALLREGGEGRAIRVATFSRSGRVRVEVEDNGPGVAETDAPRLFEIGFSTKGGEGLGLAVSRRIAESHGGRLFAEPSADGGRFVLDLPRSA